MHLSLSALGIRASSSFYTLGCRGQHSSLSYCLWRFIVQRARHHEAILETNMAVTKLKGAGKIQSSKTLSVKASWKAAFQQFYVPQLWTFKRSKASVPSGNS